MRDAVRRHFDEGQGPSLIRPHVTRDETLAAWGFRAIAPALTWSSDSVELATSPRARPAARSATFALGAHHITTPKHDSLRIGTLATILDAVVAH